MWIDHTKNSNVPVCPILESSQPQLSKSPILQFFVSVYITPAALMAWTKDVSLVAKINDRGSKPHYTLQFNLAPWNTVRKMRVKSLLAIERVTCCVITVVCVYVCAYCPLRSERTISYSTIAAAQERFIRVGWSWTRHPTYYIGMPCMWYKYTVTNFLPLLMPLYVDNWSVFSGQFHLSNANWCLHSCIPLCAPIWTLLA